MKTFNDCKEEIANREGYANWKTLIHALRYGNLYADDFFELENEAAKLFAEEVAKAQREACMMSAEIELTQEVTHKSFWNVKDKGYLQINPNSILSTPLVTDKK